MAITKMIRIILPSIMRLLFSSMTNVRCRWTSEDDETKEFSQRPAGDRSINGLANGILWIAALTGVIAFISGSLGEQV